MEPNKTLATGVSEMKEPLPNNAVVYFVSYYDYYQPEVYVPQSDTYIEKDAFHQRRGREACHQQTSSLLSRRDVIVKVSLHRVYMVLAALKIMAGLALM